MEKWELDFNWLKIQHFVKDKFNKESLPKLETVLFITGLQELGKIPEDMTLEKKLDITTLGIYKVLSLGGYYEEIGRDKDGWPLWKELKPFEPANEQERQNILKKYIIEYFENKVNT